MEPVIIVALHIVMHPMGMDGCLAGPAMVAEQPQIPSRWTSHCHRMVRPDREPATWNLKLNKIVADHTHIIGALKTEITETSAPTIIQRVQSLDTSVDERFRTGGDNVNRKLETLAMEIRAMANQHRESHRPSQLRRPA